MSTIQDVAKAAGVSVATVSRVINNSRSVSAETRELVLETIKKLNYQPNLLGRNLRRAETRLILILLPSISNPFYAKLVKGAEDVAHKNGYNVMLCNTDSDINRERMYLEHLKNRLADGLIFMSPEIDKDELTSISKRFPVVQCSEYKEGADVPRIRIDNMAAAYKAVKHLIGIGHRRIGLISAKNEYVSTKQRELGYRKALEDSGIDFDSALVKYGNYGFRSGLRAGNQLLSIDNRPTAIFAISDSMAIGAIRAAKERGLKVPADIAVVGFDDISFASMCEPPLTTISQPKYDLGCAAMEMLLAQIQGKPFETDEIVLEHELIIRQSTIDC
ncbi:MAG TPA: LacI family transcriptional regulator [Clostridiaceae bacterium]|nr:LacI family transcriptional regulator [Clostridiaceae bacterium]